MGDISKLLIRGFSETRIILTLLFLILLSTIIIKLLSFLFFNSPIEEIPLDNNQTIYKSKTTIIKKTINMGNSKVTVVEGTGYPTADDSGIGQAIKFMTGFTPTYYGSVVVYNFSSGVIANCNVSYNHISGRVILTTTGC